MRLFSTVLIFSGTLGGISVKIGQDRDDLTNVCVYLCNTKLYRKDKRCLHLDKDRVLV